MPNQEQSRDGKPRPDADRPSPDLGPRGQARAQRADGSGKIGVTSDAQPDLVAPSGVNERDHGAAEDKPQAGGALNFDDGTDMAHPRGEVRRDGRTWDEHSPSDAGELGAPGAGLSDRNGPSDPASREGR